MTSMKDNGIKVINNAASESQYVIVAGGAGYVGRYFVNYLLKNYPNKKIIIVTRNLSKKMFFRDERVEFVTGFDKLKIKDCDIYNFVYTGSSSFHYGPKIAKGYIDSLVGALEQGYKSTIFHISSIAVYNAVKNPDYKNPSKLTGLKKNDPYSYTKAITENYLLKKAAAKNAAVKVLRIGNVMAPGSIWIKILVKRLQFGLPITADSAHPSNTTYVSNLAYILDKLAKSTDNRGFYNICEFGNISWEQWTIPLANLLDETPVKWAADDINGLKYGVKEDLKFLKGKVYTAVVPNVMKLAALNTRILKLLSKRDLDKSRTEAKQIVRNTVAQPYLDVQEYKMAGIYLEDKTIHTEGLSQEIVKDLPCSYEEVVEVIERYIRYNID